MSKYNHIELLLKKDNYGYNLGDNAWKFHDRNLTTGIIRNFNEVICHEWVDDYIGNKPQYIRLIIKSKAFPRAISYRKTEWSSIFTKGNKKIMSFALLWHIARTMDSKFIWVKAEPVDEETYLSSVWGDRIENL